MADKEDEKQLTQKVARVFDESRASYAIHNRKLKELSALHSSSPTRLFSAFSKSLTPLFDFQRRSSSAERIVRFVSVYAVHRDEKNPSNSDDFLEEFVRFLLIASASANKTCRFRSCQIISEIIMRLPDDAEVSSELWDEVIDCMKLRVGDKVPAIRSYAVRALARFASEAENVDVLDLFLQTLDLEQNAEVRKTIVLSLPPTSATSATLIQCTLDVNEAVRKATYCVLANKFPLQTLSIKFRTIILQRGLADRSLLVSKECLKLMKEEWLVKCCDGDPVALLKYLDVETYESVGEAVMESLLKAGMVDVQEDQSVKQYIVSNRGLNEGEHVENVKLMEPEVALFWRTVCKHLQNEAQVKGSDAATTTGAEAAVYAAEASDTNDLLERVLPATISDYVELVKAHLVAGPNYRFTSRQLLLLGGMLDFSDSTNRKTASAFVQELLHKPIEHEVDTDGNRVIIGDGINLGGDREWATAVSELAKKVHASAGEFEQVVVGAVEELARPCRERAANFIQWMHCLEVTGLLLENVKSIHCLRGGAMEPSELLHSLLLPGARHVHLDVQRVAIRCLGLYGVLERKPSEDLVKQLRLSFSHGPSSVSIMATKALLDLGLWHGPQEVDRAMSHDLSQPEDGKKDFNAVNFGDINGDLSTDLLDLLYAGLERDDWGKSLETDDQESVKAILGEGFAKFLLLSGKYPSISASLHPLLLSKLISLYFSSDTEELPRLKQCLSVFFEHYPALSAKHKHCISKALIPVMRTMWPGIYGNSGGSSFLVSSLRKRAVQAARFMLQMMQVPLYSKENEVEDDNGNKELVESVDSSGQLSPDFDCGEEGLAIRIATEVASFPMKKAAAGKAYMSALCKILVLLHFRSSEQATIKCMRGLLNRLAESVFADKDVLKELTRMASRLKALDEHPDQELSQDQADLIFGKLELDANLDMDTTSATMPTPAPRSTRPTRYRRRVRSAEVSSDESETEEIAAVPATPSIASTRSQRASKVAALNKMSVRKVAVTEEEDDEEDEEGQVSDVTSEDDSDPDEFIE